MDNLLPCPFCGGEAVVTDCVYHLATDNGDKYEKKGWTVGCRTPGCRGWFNRYINTEAEAIAAWNTRDCASIDDFYECSRHVKPRTLEDVLQSAGVSIAAIGDVAAEIRELLAVEQ